MRVRYIGVTGQDNLVALKIGNIYEVMSIEYGWYRIMTEINEDYLFPPDYFEVINIDGTRGTRGQ